jgi:hypothetical protein
MSEIWIDHASIEDWRDARCWTEYFTEAGKILALPLTRLDVADPPRRKAGALNDAGNYACTFGVNEDSRWLFGKFGSSGIDFSIQHYRRLDRWPNSLSWYVPSAFLEQEDGPKRLRELFDLGNRTLKPFYSYSDDIADIKSKKSSSASIDLSVELLGVFWMTYFGAAYVDFFGKEKFDALSGVEFAGDGGVTIVLGDRPGLVPKECRERAAISLGRRSFVDVNSNLGKLTGQYALPLQRLVELRKRH